VNGAESLVRTLLACGVDTCFANPGTSEMHFVAALDAVPGMRCVLGLAEGVVTGCADGYGRMALKPAATLLHCGPGFANGIANLHNARRGRTPVVNIVGDHATYHRPYDPPLASDVQGLARPVSDWVRSSEDSVAVGRDAAAAVQAALTPPGQVATLILPADASWSEGAEVGCALPVPARRIVDGRVVREVAALLQRKEPTVILLGDDALGERGLAAAQRIARATGARLRATGQVRRMARGRGRAPVDRVPYALDQALEVFAGVRHIVLAGAAPPVQFFAYPGKPSVVYPPDAQLHTLAGLDEDQAGALEALAEGVGASDGMVSAAPPRSEKLPRGPFTHEGFGAVFEALLPEDAIVADEAVTSGRQLFGYTFNAPPHDWLQLTGGAIGHALPCATGAAVAAPGRKVVCLQADGGGMYSLQALWTQARENLDVLTVIFANRAYRILQGELLAVGARPGPASKDLFDLGRPDLDWTMLARGMGVEAARAETLEAFADVFTAACARRGPFLIELRV
jgi:acetolactate synthase I/II/III large subunit